MTDPTVRGSVRRHLKGERGPLKAVALELARRLDDPEAPGAASVARELRATLRELDLEHVEVPEPEGDDEETEEQDPVDDLATQRARRRAAAAGQ